MGATPFHSPHRKLYGNPWVLHRPFFLDRHFSKNQAVAQFAIAQYLRTLTESPIRRLWQNRKREVLFRGVGDIEAPHPPTPKYAPPNSDRSTGCIVFRPVFGVGDVRGKFRKNKIRFGVIIVTKRFSFAPHSRAPTKLFRPQINSFGKLTRFRSYKFAAQCIVLEYQSRWQFLSGRTDGFWIEQIRNAISHTVTCVYIFQSFRTCIDTRETA